MPGTEIGIGATTLVAESSRMAHLRKFCQRLLGWGPGRLLAVDQALRALRLARAHRASLILCGDGDLVPIAYALHRRTFDHAAPFIACDPRRMDMPGDVRSPPNVRRVVEAFARASGGTLCLRARRLPHGVDKVIQRAWEPDSEVQLVVCASHTPSALLTGTTAIQLPPLRLRQMELPRIIAEYTVDAVASLGLRPDREYVTDADHRWITARSAMSLIEIEKATLRIIALAASRTVFQAAARLGMASVSLLRWLGRRGYDIRRSAISNEPADTIGDHP
jgi:hypothetical protein